MRNDISNAIKLKTDSRKQTISENAAPYLSLIVARKETILDDFSFTERRRVRRTTKNTITDVAIAVSHPKAGRDDTEIFIAYIKSNNVYLRHSLISAEISDVDWSEIPLENALAGTKVDVAFDPMVVTNRQGKNEYVTTRRPFVFYLWNGWIRCVDSEDGTETPLWGTGITDFSARQTPWGLGIFYVKSDAIYYRIRTNGTWGSETAVGVSLGKTIDALSTFNTLDGFGIQAQSGTNLYYLVGAYNNSVWSWGSWMGSDYRTVNGTGVLVEYYDGKRELFYNNNGFYYATETSGNPWSFASDEKLYKVSYAAIEHDHTNPGTLYFATIMHGDQDIIYFFRYAYMRDVSAYTKSVEQRLQTDNPITQINVTLKNIDDTLYTSEATLFTPSSIMRLGVSYGDSDIVPMGVGYIDQATIEYGGAEVSLSGRNKTGVYLKDQTFEEDMHLTDVPSLVVEHIMEHFGLINQYECDDRYDLIGGNPNIVDLEVKAKTTGLQAMETLNKVMTQDSANKQWRFEETYDGTIVVGYDDFRTAYVPKNFYTFNGRNDVFAESVDRCIDGVYNKVHVTGTTPKGKEISYTYNVTNFRFWDVGENRIYHANKIEGITKTELKKYAKALAKQLKYIGRTITYKMNLKPQLLIGDVATITYSDDPEPEELGYITEINHTLGEDGYFTEFTITSGGNVTTVTYTPPQTRSLRSVSSEERVYVADKSVNGTNRITRLADFFGLSGTNTSISAGTTVLQGDSLNLPELIRNIGFRLLDEPKDVQVLYDEDDNEVKLKWTDPNDINTFEPLPVDWAGTVVVRNDNGAPLHPWDGVLIVDSTTRDEYKNDWLVDDNNLMRGTMYYYGIFPYHIGLDDYNHPIKHYRWTKVITVRAGGDLETPNITSIEVSGVNATVFYSIPTLKNGSYTSITLAVKKNGTPLSADDGDEIVSLPGSDTSVSITGLDELSTYYFVIFTEDEQGNTATSEPVKADIPRDTEWHGQEVAILWSGENNKMTAQVSNSHIVFKLYTSNTEIYSFNAYAGSTVADADNIYVGFLIDTNLQLAKPSMVYANGSVLSYNQESPTNAEMGDIYTWLSAGLPSE